MVFLLAIRCLNCNNIDDFPRMDYDEIPYCSQCASTSNLVPTTPPAKPQQPSWNTAGDDLSALFSRNLSLLDNPPPTPPMSSTTTSPTTANFSISQHYHHSVHIAPQPPAPPPQQELSKQDQTYLQYLLNSNLGSAHSQNELEIALAHGIISHQAYTTAVSAFTEQMRLNTERERYEAQMRGHGQDMQMGEGLQEDCDAASMLAAAQRERERKQDPTFRSSDFFNDYYGGVDTGMMDDEETPCSFYGAAQGRLKPFDL
ncbi:hypothetical protein RUND412_004179 [Rhizina undulata]